MNLRVNGGGLVGRMKELVLLDRLTPFMAAFTKHGNSFRKGRKRDSFPIA